MVNIYCDESCHLEHDRQPIMVLGAVWCATDQARQIAVRIREIKVRHHLNPRLEVKWEKVSPAKQAFYFDLLDYFFDDDNLHFRALIADKVGLQHERYAQDHDTWYYKMYFSTLTHLFDPENRYRIYLDVKDSHSSEKLHKLHDVLCNNLYDFESKIIERVQAVRSHEIEQIQLADLLTGAVAYANRMKYESPAKTEFVRRMRMRSGYSFTRSTLFRARKVNIFHWSPRRIEEDV